MLTSSGKFSFALGRKLAGVKDHLISIVDLAVSILVFSVAEGIASWSHSVLSPLLGCAPL